MPIMLSDYEKKCELLRTKVFSSVAHDLKTPLAAIIGSLGVLSYMWDKLSSEQRSVLIKTSLLEAERLDGFITEMLDKVKP